MSYAVATLRSLPAVGPAQRHEADGEDGLALHSAALLRDDGQRLHVPSPERYQQLAAFGELVHQRLGDARRRGADEDRVVRTILAPPEGTVAEEQRDVPDPGARDRVPGPLQQRCDALDGEDLCGEMRQKHGLITGSGSHLEHFLMSLELQQLEVSRMDGRLGDRLAVPDRQRRILVRAMPNPRGDEQVARGRFDGAQDREIRDPLLAQRLDQPTPRPAELTFYRSRHHDSAASSA